MKESKRKSVKPRQLGWIGSMTIVERDWITWRARIVEPTTIPPVKKIIVHMSPIICHLHIVFSHERHLDSKYSIV